ncbi:MAG: hypothetical protein RLO21_01510, partial [Nitratireductor sp.]
MNVELVPGQCHCMRVTVADWQPIETADRRNEGRAAGAERFLRGAVDKRVRPRAEIEAPSNQVLQKLFLF